MQEENRNNNIQTVTKHHFYFETPLYEGTPRDQFESDCFTGEVDAYSALNRTETTYDISQTEIATNYDYDNAVSIGYYFVTLTCKRKSYDTLRFFIYKSVDAIFKVGQNPSLADLQFAEIDKKYNKVLPTEDLKNLKKAIGLVSHGAGAGSFVYLRRIFEKLILETFKNNFQVLGVSEADFQKERMLDKIEILKDYLPSQLVEMKSIYTILGKGVHELTEQECLKYFAPIKLSIELILDQKIEEKQKQEKDKNVKQQLAEIQKELAQSKKETEEKKMKTSATQKNTPDGWKMKRIKDIAPLQRGFDLPVNSINKGNYPVVFSNGILKYHNAFKAKGPGVVTGRSGTIGQVHYVEENYWPHNTALWVTDFKDNSPKFVFYFYKFFNLSRFGAGSGVPTLNRNDVHIQKVLVPKHLEQNRIVAVLETWDKAIEKLEMKIEIKKKIKKGLMQQLLTGEIRLQGFNIPWKFVKLSDICKITMGQSPSSNAYNEKNEGLPLIQGNNDIKERKTIRRIWTTEITKKANKGDIIMTVRAPVGLIGVATEKVCIGRGVCAIAPTKVYNLYILTLLEYYESRWKTFEQGSTFTAVNSSDIKGLNLNIPVSKEEQIVIANILNHVDEEITILKKKLKIIKDQKKYLLNSLITGEIRTPEDLKIN